MTTTNTHPPTLRYEIGSIVTPGDRIGTIRQGVLPGKGMYAKGGHLYASAVGRLVVTRAAPIKKQEEEKEGGSSPIPSFFCSIHVEQNKPMATSHGVLTVGQLVLGRVDRISPQNATVEISVAQHVGALKHPHEGTIRMEDIRAGASEQVALDESFLPGDLVVCRVIALGDSRRYFLSTAESELGVVRAISKTSGLAMIPSSWKEMVCPETEKKEFRKCAKPGSRSSSSAATTATTAAGQQQPPSE
jgi:exosome complex component CSL4